MKVEKDGFILSDDIDSIDANAVCSLLKGTYWASNRPIYAIRESIKNSICFGLFFENKQIGFARVITDKVVASWICDVVISEEFRRKGLGKLLMMFLLEHPDIKNTKKYLSTDYAQDFYRRFGFEKGILMKKKL